MSHSFSQARSPDKEATNIWLQDQSGIHECHILADVRYLWYNLVTETRRSGHVKGECAIDGAFDGHGVVEFMFF